MLHGEQRDGRGNVRCRGWSVERQTPHPFVKRLSRSGDVLAESCRIVDRAIPEHGHENSKPAINDAPKGARMTVASRAESAVVGATRVVALDADAAPVIRGLAQSLIAGA